MTGLLLAVCGGLGAAFRYLVDTLIRERMHVGPATSTLIVNVIGSFVFGLCVCGLNLLAPGPSAVHYLTGFGIVAAFCGGFTTFSTAMVDALTLIHQRKGGRAAFYLLGTFALCVIAMVLGVVTTYVIGMSSLTSHR